MHEAGYGLLSPVWAGTQIAGMTGDAAICDAMQDAEIALAHAQGLSGIIPKRVARDIAEGLGRFHPNLAEIARRSALGGNPVIPLVSDMRAHLGGEAGAAVHRGATSQDILDTALMLVAARSIDRFREMLIRAVEGLIRLATEHATTVSVGRTLGQHSVPISFGAKVAGWLGGLTHATAELDRVRATLPAQLGGAAGNLSALVGLAARSGATDPENTALTVAADYARELGLGDPIPPWHVRRTPITGLGDALAGIVDIGGSIARDILLASRPEVGELREPAAAGRGTSSTMPQKRNPILSVRLQAAAYRGPELAATLHRCAGGASDERPDGSWHAEWSALIELLRLTGAAAEILAELLPGLEVDTVRMRQNLEISHGLVFAETLMMQLAPEIGRASVQDLIDRASVPGAEPLADLLARSLPEGSLPRIHELLDPAAALGISAPLIERAVECARGRLDRKDPS